LALPAFNWFLEIGFFHFCDFNKFKTKLVIRKTCNLRHHSDELKFENYQPTCQLQN